MVDIVKIIEEKRKKTEDDNQVLQVVMENLPDKKDAFQKAIERGASSTQILEKIIEDNKKKLEEEKLPTPKKEKDSFFRKIKKRQASLKGSHFFKDFFTATRYLLIGVDISDYSIEVLLLDKDGTISSYGRSILEEGVVQNGEILNQKLLSKTLRETLENTKPYPMEVSEHGKKKRGITFQKKEHKAIVSLPESKVYVQTFVFENRDNLQTKIAEKIKLSIPFEEEDFYWDFIEIPSSKGVKITCVATLRDFADEYIHFFKSTNIDPVAFEVEGEAIGRALLPTKTIRGKEKKGLFKKKREEKQVMADRRSRMIIDIGARDTILSIFNEEALLTVSVPLPYAGNYFTRKVAQEFNISNEEAEKKKQDQGFKKDGDTYKVLSEQGEKIVKEIKDAQRYYKSEFNSEVKEILLAGGSSLLPGIVEFFNEKVEGVTVKLGDPLNKIKDLGLLDGKESILYASVIGLGLRSLKKDPIDSGINLLPEEVKSQAQKTQQETQRSVLLVASFVLIAGIMLLSLAVYYLVYLPVPAPMQPLKNRILLVMEREDVTIDIAIVREDLEESPPVHQGPGTATEIIGTVEMGGMYRVTGQRAGWVRIEFEDISGWIVGDNLQTIRTIDEEDFEEVIFDIEEDEEEVIEDE